jgi:predicted anti-sigma-YlaC factor YlaD
MITSNALTCKEVVELVSDYLEHALAPETRAQFEDHVAHCPGCTNYVQQVQKTIDMLHRLTEQPVFPQTKEELLQLFEQWKEE